jgi:hypothetical protein
LFLFVSATYFLIKVPLGFDKKRSKNKIACGSWLSNTAVRKEEKSTCATLFNENTRGCLTGVRELPVPLHPEIRIFTSHWKR